MTDDATEFVYSLDPEVMRVAARNQYAILSGRNLDNHSASIAGRPVFVQSGMPHGRALVFRTKQEIYRMAAWLLHYAELADLPNEVYPLTFEQIQEWVEQHG